ncbi:hypothetical protein ACQKGD_29025 [Peribacillus frigoritolerans]|uniref:hypothetical protein n=1 Tax=Peribacillus frigoritolerans TaxID=450367 RepID=UPI003D067D43
MQIQSPTSTPMSMLPRWYQKAGATVSVASNFIPGAGQAKWAAKGAVSAVKYGKKAKKVKKFKAAPLKKERKQKSKPKPLKLNLQFFSKSNGTHRQLTSMKVKDSHHIIQDAAVRDIPGYHRNNAPAIHLQGPNKKGTEHYKASKVQRQSGGGTYASERRIGYKAMRRAGVSRDQARREIKRADKYFGTLKVNPKTKTHIPGNRKRR